MINRICSVQLAVKDPVYANDYGKGRAEYQKMCTTLNKKFLLQQVSITPYVRFNLAIACHDSTLHFA